MPSGMMGWPSTRSAVHDHDRDLVAWLCRRIQHDAGGPRNWVPEQAWNKGSMTAMTARKKGDVFWPGMLSPGPVRQASNPPVGGIFGFTGIGPGAFAFPRPGKSS